MVDFLDLQDNYLARDGRSGGTLFIQLHLIGDGHCSKRGASLEEVVNLQVPELLASCDGF